MSSSETPHSSAIPLGSPKISPLRSIAAVLALSLGCFTFVSTELMPVGVLPEMAKGLGVSLGAVGYLVTLFAFVVALTAAPLTAMLSQINRRVLMAGLLATCFTGNLITGLASDYWFVLAGRLLISLANGVFWSTAVVTAVHMVSAKNAVNATSVVFAGISLATVLGIPVGTFLGGIYGWRTVFVALCLLSLFSFTLIIWTLPAIQIPRAAKRGALSLVFKSPALVSLLVITALVGTGNYLAYTYITPFLMQVAGQGPTQISLLLLVYGIAGMIANFTIAPFAARAPYMSLGCVTALLSLSLLCLNMSAAHHSTVAITMAIWGAAYGAVPVLLQTLIFKRALQSQGGADAATSASVSVFNAAIGIGALMGGAMINILGASPIPYVAAAFAFVGVGVTLYSRYR